MKASILIVHFGDAKPTLRCIKSINKSGAKDYEIILIDNNLNDRDRGKFTNVRYFKSDLNNYCHALNIGFKKAKNDIVVVLNPDTEVHKDWLKEIMRPFSNKKIAGVSSKVLFKKTGKINSLGIEEIDNYYYRDLAFNEEDDPDLKIINIKYASGCSVAYRKSAINKVNGFDEDFVMYVEDVDMGIKLREAGYQLVVNPKSVVDHAYHGTSKGADLPWYFCNRNRFLIIAKYHPEKFAKQIQKSHPYINKQFNYLYEFIKVGILKLIKEGKHEKYLPKILEEVSDIFPLDRVQNMINEIELYLGLRKPRICLYDHALHFIGGGQKYGATIAEGLQKDFDVTYITNKPVTIKNIEDWYDLTLSKCKLKIIELPICKKEKLINPSKAETMAENPFAKVEDEVLNYDVLINVNMVPHVNALALKNLFLCHFPDVNRLNHFYVAEYDTIIANSKYTEGWIKKRWKLNADEIVYPPVDMQYKGKPVKKENIILSVSRFEETGSKKQLELIKEFKKLDLGKNWKLILAGGALQNSKYLGRVKNLIKMLGVNAEIYENISNSDLKKLYSRAKIFWHACGLGVDETKNPHLIEHFGMTTVEAMQNGCVPVVINGGGQREIIEHGINGFKFKNEKELRKLTMRLISSEKLREDISKMAQKTAKKYNKANFQTHLNSMVSSHIQQITHNKNFIPQGHEAYKRITSSSETIF